MNTSDWIRLTLLLSLGLLSGGFGGWLARTVAAAVLAFLFHLQEGATWPGCVQAGLAVAYLFPLLGVLTQVRFALMAILVIGVPSLLVSHYSCESSWAMGCADAFALTLLVPVSIIKCLVWMEVIEPPGKTEAKVTSPNPSPTSDAPSPSRNIYHTETHAGAASSPVPPPGHAGFPLGEDRPRPW